MAVVFGTKPKRRASKRSHLEERLALYIASAKLPVPQREVRFAPPRLWRFDFAWPDRKLAVEIEGGVFVQGRHSRGVDFTEDCEKYNIATLLGWKVYRFTVKQFESGWVFSVVGALLAPTDDEARQVLARTVGTATRQPALDIQPIR